MEKNLWDELELLKVENGFGRSVETSYEQMCFDPTLGAPVTKYPITATVDQQYPFGGNDQQTHFWRVTFIVWAM